MQKNNEKVTLTVSQLNEYIKMMLDNSPVLSNIYICGEISNFTNHYKSGHFYFTLKDNNAAIKAVMFSSNTSKLKFTPDNGMKVIVHGRVSSFVRDGVYQIYVNTMDPSGVGSLYLAFEQLKNKLSMLGLFDQINKKPLPEFPSCVGIITSDTGAALQDILNISKRRYPICNILVYPALVQGEKSAQQLLSGIQYFNKSKLCDVIIITRGGGSIEDLWSFNDEALAYEIHKSEIPVVSAVGHEIDFTICDLVSDMRAPTPSAAAEIVFPDSSELKKRINKIYNLIGTYVEGKLKNEKEKISKLANSRVLLTYSNVIDDKKIINDNYYIKLRNSADNIIAHKKQQLQNNASLLNALSPLMVISRGYGIVFDDDENVVKSILQIKENDEVKIKISDGKLLCNVKNIIKEK